MLNFSSLFRWSTILFVFLIPLGDTVRIDGLGSVLQLFGLINIVLFFIVIARANKIPELLPIHIVMILFAIWMTATIFWSWEPLVSADRALTFFQLVIFSLIVFYAVRGERDLANLAKAYILGSFFTVIATINQFVLQAGYSGTERYVFSGQDPNDFALYVILGLFFCLYLLVSNFRWPMWILYGMMLIFSFSIILSGSRAVFISLLIFAVGLVYIEGKRSINRALAVTGLIGICIAAVLLLAPASIIDRIIGITSEIEGGTLASRRYIWYSGLLVLENNFAIGVGAGAFAFASGDVGGVYRPSHNAYLSAFVEGGIPGIILFSSLFVSAALFIRRLKGNYKVVFSLLLLSYMVGIFTLTWEYKKPLWLALAYICAVVAVQRRMSAKVTYEARNEVVSRNDHSAKGAS